MKVHDLIVAEDIRSEQGNKHSIMGVFSDAMTINVPANAQGTIALRLAFFLRLEIMASDPDSFKFEFAIFLDETHISGFEGMAGKGPGEGDGLIVLPLVANIIQVPGPGELRFDLRTRDSSGKELLYESLRPIKVLVNRY